MRREPRSWPTGSTGSLRRNPHTSRRHGPRGWSVAAMRTGAGAALLLLVVGCQGPADVVPSQMGSSPVGVKTITVEDPDPPGAGADGTPRKLVTEVWSPATDAAIGQP